MIPLRFLVKGLPPPRIFDPSSIFDRSPRILAINPNLSRRSHDSFRLIFLVSSRLQDRDRGSFSSLLVAICRVPRLSASRSSFFFFFFTSSFDGEERRREEREEGGARKKKKEEEKKKIRERDGKKEVLLMAEAPGNEESGSFQGCSIECRWDLIITRIISNFKKSPLIARPRENSKSAH